MPQESEPHHQSHPWVKGNQAEGTGIRLLSGEPLHLPQL